MASAGVDQYTFHIEPVDNVAHVCRKVREANMKVINNNNNNHLFSILNCEKF